MATLKQRLHKRNSSGSYDTVYLETNTDMVLLTDGSTTLTSKLSTMDSNISGKAASGHKHAAGDITSGTLSSSRLPTVSVSKGGTGKTTLTSGRYLVGNGTNAVAEKTPANVLTDIGAVNKAGDTMTGSLSIEASPYSDLKLKDKTNSSYTILRNTAHRTQIMSQSDDKNYRALTLHDKNSTEEASNILQIQEIVNGVQSTAYRVYHTGYETTPAKIGAAAASHKHAATDITTGTLPVARGGTGVTTIDALKKSLGITANKPVSGGSGGISGSTAAGGTMTFDNMTWTVVDNGTYNSNERVLILTDIYHLMNGHDIERFCTYFWEYVLSAEARAKCIPHCMKEFGANAHTLPVFVPTYTEVDSGFSYFRSAANRIAKYNGTAKEWWTSTPYSGGIVNFVTPSGLFNGYNFPIDMYGFRPCVALKI